MSDTNITPGSGSLTLSGKSGLPQLPQFQANGTDSYSTGRLAPYQLNGTDVSAGARLPPFTLLGGSAIITPATGVLMLTPQNASVFDSGHPKYIVIPPQATLGLTGYAPILGLGITPGAGALVITGAAASTAIQGSFSLLLRTLSATGSPAFIAQFDLALRTLTSSAYVGGVGRVAFITPLRAITISANVGTTFTLPLRTISATAVVGGVGNASFATPLRTISASAIATVVATAQFQTLLRSLSTVAIAGITASASFSMPRRTLSANGLNGSAATASFNLLLRTFSTIAYPALTATATFGLPLRYLNAAGFPSVAENYRTWVMNARTGSLVEYNNFQFNSIIKFGDRYLASGPNGLFVLGGDDDAGTEIASLVRTGLPDYGNSFLKRLSRIYVSGDFRGDMYFSTISTEDGKRTYTLVDNGIIGEQQRRVGIGKGPKSVRWQLEMANKDGAKFGLSKMIVYPKNLRRRVQ